MSGRGGKLVITTTAIITSIYFGINFWKSNNYVCYFTRFQFFLISKWSLNTNRKNNPSLYDSEQLEKDGNLRKDIEIDHRNSNTAGSEAIDQPKSWQDLRQKINAVIDPEKNFTAEDQKGLQRLKDRLQSSNPNGSSNDEK